MNYALRYPKFWLGYLLYCAVMVAANTVYEAVTHFGAVSAWSVAGTLLSVLNLWSLYGYVRQVRYARRWLWMIVLGAEGLVVIAAVAICLIGAVSSISVLPPLAAAAVVLLSGPALFALHQYIFRSPHIWA